jgi:hypothetical protein
VGAAAARQLLTRLGAIPAAGALVVLLLLLLVSEAAAAPEIVTDKVEYAPEETVTITGSGFAGNTNYDVPVIRPDGSIITGDGTSTPGWDTVRSKQQGTFTYSYLLETMFGLYEVRVYPSPWSGDLDETPLATTTFLDAIGKSLNQCRNGEPAVPVDPCVWHNGNLNPSNSHYSESESVPYRATLTKVPASEKHYIRIQYDFTAGGIFAFDYLTLYDRTESPGPCVDLPSGVETTWGPSACPPSGRSTDTASIPSDPFDPDGGGPLPAVSAIDLPQVDREIEIRGGTILDIGTVDDCTVGNLVGPTLDGTEVSIPEHDGPISGNSTACVDIEFQADATCESGECTVLFLWGGHLASELNWGIGNGAASVSGAPFHMAYQVDGTDGKPDRSIQTGAILQQGTITIAKDAVPDDAQDFSFSGDLGNFSLDDDADGTLPNSTDFVGVSPGTYSVTETLPSGWDVTDITCVDPTSNSSGDTGTGAATIIVEKQTVPDSAVGDFEFTGDAAGTIQGDGQIVVSNLLPGSYSSTEADPTPGFDLTSIVCDDANSGGDVGTHADTHAYSNPHAHAYANTHPNADTHAYAHAHTNADAHADTDAHAYTTRGCQDYRSVVPEPAGLLPHQYGHGPHDREDDPQQRPLHPRRCRYHFHVLGTAGLHRHA